MKKHLLWSACLLSILASYACNDEIKIDNRSFKELCEISGGNLSLNGNVCECGNNPCGSGIICIDKGRKCADFVLEGSECDDVGAILCYNVVTQENPNVAANLVKCTSSDNGLKWISFGTCASSCSYSELNSCGDCVNGSTQCRDGNEYICENGKWNDEPTANQYKYSCNADKLGVCVNNDVICIENKYKTCLNGAWSEFENCPNNHSCSSENACGSCSNGSKQCNAGTPQICSEGKWVDMPNPNKYSCHDDELGECQNFSSRCDNGISSVCKNGKWEQNIVCPDNTCNNENTDCGWCVDGNVNCVENKYRLCVNGVWSEFENCPNNHSCSSENACGVCVNDTKKCSDGKISQCIQGAWSEAIECSFSSCKDNESCSDCEENDESCVGENQIRICKNGKWVDIGNTEDVSCTLEHKRGECLNSSTKCKNGKYQTCINGTWSDEIECPNGNSCDENGENCGECSNDALQCTSDAKHIEKCIWGTWKQTEECSTGTLCRDGECVDASCDSNDEWCVDGEISSTHYHCVGMMIVAESCSGGNSCNCVNGNCTSCGKCKNGISYFEDDGVCKSVTCANGQQGTPTIVNGNSCRFDIEKNVFTGPGECLNGEQAFKNDESTSICGSYQCSNGQLVLAEPDVKGNSCKVKDNKLYGFGDCNNTSFITKYENDINNKCIKTYCQNGEIKIDTSDYSCNNNYSDFGTCNNVSFAVKYINNGEGKCIKTYCKEGKILEDISVNSCNKDNNGFGVCNNYDEPTFSNNGSKHCVKSSCVNGAFKTEELASVSCNSDNTDYGDCLNETSECLDVGDQGYRVMCVKGHMPNQSEVHGSITDGNIADAIKDYVVACPNESSCTATSTCGECPNGWFKNLHTYTNNQGIEVASTGENSCVCKMGKWQDIDQLEACEIIKSKTINDDFLIQIGDRCKLY